METLTTDINRYIAVYYSTFDRCMMEAWSRLKKLGRVVGKLVSLFKEADQHTKPYHPRLVYWPESVITLL